MAFYYPLLKLENLHFGKYSVFDGELNETTDTSLNIKYEAIADCSISLA